MRHACLIAAALAGAAPALAAPKLSPEEQLAKLTRGAAPGKPTTCINLPMARDSQVIDKLGIVYKIGNTYYLNRFNDSCLLTTFDTLITSTPSTQLCRGDIARVVDSNAPIPRGSCTFGDFVPYEVKRR